MVETMFAKLLAGMETQTQEQVCGPAALGRAQGAVWAWTTHCSRQAGTHRHACPKATTDVHELHEKNTVSYSHHPGNKRFINDLNVNRRRINTVYPQFGDPHSDINIVFWRNIY